MKKQSLKLFAFIIALTTLSASPEIISAQTLKKCTPQGKCPKGYFCTYDGYCAKIWPVCPRCPYFFLTEASSANEPSAISSSSPNTIGFLLTQTKNVSAKLYDATGRLIKILADKVFEKGEHQLQMDVAGINPGVYMVRFNTGSYAEMKRITVIK